MNRWVPLRHMIFCRLREFFREPHAIFWVYGFPLILAVILGMAFSGGKPIPAPIDVQRVEDSKIQEEMRKMLEAAGHGGQVCDKPACDANLRAGKSALYVIPAADRPTYVFDPTRAESVSARDAVDALYMRTRFAAQLTPALEHPVTQRGSTYIDFLFPGLIGMNLMGGGLFGIGFVIVDMRVRKLFKRLMATPMRRSDLLLSIVVSRMVFLIPEMSMLLLVGHFGFGVPIYGDVLAVAIIILAGVGAFDGLGLLISCRTESTETASGLINLCMLPMYLVSGTFFSSKRFPDVVQPFIQALPLTQINDALREVMLEGKALTEVWWRVAILLGWATVCGGLALKWFRWR